MDRVTARKREAGFLSREGNAAAVYRFDAGAMEHPAPLEWARTAGESPIVSGYDLTATGPIMEGVDALAPLSEPPSPPASPDAPLPARLPIEV